MMGVQVSIYSSGSREAQGLLFGHSEVGDLRRYLSCYFDTTVGGKRQVESYTDIALSLGKYVAALDLSRVSIRTAQGPPALRAVPHKVSSSMDCLPGS